MFKKLADFASKKGYELLKKRGAHCPECGRPLSLPRELPEDGFKSTIKCHACSWMGSIGGLNRSPDSDQASDGGRVDRIKPADSKIKEVIGIQKATWLIPAKKGFNFLMFFAAFWLSIVSFITFGLIAGSVDMEGGGDLPSWAGGLFLIPFWLIGLGVGYVGLRMAYTELLIRVDQDAVVLTRKFFNRMWDKSIPREHVGKVDLGVAYRQNERPVYQIEIMANEGAGIKFGSNLSDDDKQWMLGGLRNFLKGPEVNEYGGAMAVAGGAVLSDAVEVESKTLKIERVGHVGFRITRIYRAGPWFLGIGLAVVVGMVIALVFQWEDFDGDRSSGIGFFFELLFTAVPFLMTLIGLLVGVGLLAGGYWAMGRKKVFEFSDSGLVLTTHWRSNRKQKKFPRSEFRKVNKKNSGHVNNDPRYKVVLISDRQTLAVCDYENEEVADAVQAWLGDWVAG